MSVSALQRCVQILIDDYFVKNLEILVYQVAQLVEPEKFRLIPHPGDGIPSRGRHPGQGRLFL